jgi:hypothetical protein
MAVLFFSDMTNLSISDTGMFRTQFPIRGGYQKPACILIYWLEQILDDNWTLVPHASHDVESLALHLLSRVATLVSAIRTFISRPKGLGAGDPHRRHQAGADL